jgi:Fe-S cluster assembly protein SufD
MMAPATGAAAYSREALEARLGGEPDWLRESRLAALDVFERTPLATTRTEEWRYTDPRLLKWDAVELAPLRGPTYASFAPDERAKRAAAGAGWVLTADTAVQEIELAGELRDKGVLLLDLATAALEHDELLRRYLGQIVTPESGKFAALNGAFWSAGVLLYVPRGVRIETPIRISRSIEESGFAYFPRLLVVAEEGSQVGVIEYLTSPHFEQPAFTCGAVEIHAGTAAKVQHVSLQRWGTGVRHYSTQRTVAGRDASLDTLVVNLGASVARVDLAASLEGPGARSDMLGLYFGRGDQHFDHNTRQDHRVPHASSDLLYKGALDGSSRAVFRGLIKVFPKAQRTDAYQTNRNLILSKEAEATSLPNLEIEADDVRCSHAATVGQLDREELFYIMSRGVPRNDAERLVVFGFFGDVLDRLPLPEVVQELRAAIEEKIG